MNLAKFVKLAFRDHENQKKNTLNNKESAIQREGDYSLWSEKNWENHSCQNFISRNFNSSELRLDMGGLWENFCISERIKYNQNHRRFVNTYFWRTYDQQEIDYIEEIDGKLICFEFKYNAQAKSKFPKVFQETYPESDFKIINPDNFYELMGLG
jgi:predicted AAA+ superfamily ATPase